MCVLVVSFAASAKEKSKLHEVFGCHITEKICVVKYNEGGDVSDFLKAAMELKKNNLLLVVDGDCFSSCAMAADVTRKPSPSDKLPNSCVTPLGVFYFHQGVRSRPVGYYQGMPVYRLPIERFVLPRTLSIDEWNKKKGGWPTDGYNVMRYPETLKYWEECQLPVEPLPKMLPSFNPHKLY